MQSVPCLTTAISGPLKQLEKQFLANQVQIEMWFRQAFQEMPPPIYGSVDLRNAGFKLAPVDMNLFPAGFNNLNSDFLPLCIQAIEETLEKQFPNTKKILIIPESHTRNLFYFEHLFVLQDILLKAGFESRIGSLSKEITAPTVFSLANNRTLTIEPLMREANRLKLTDFDPDFILLNNDLSDGVPDILQSIEQPIYPSAKLGWHARLKSNHFAIYEKIAEDFSNLIHIDPWLISPLFQYCDEINFLKREGIYCLIKNAENLFQAIQAKYDEYQIKEKPFIIVKADAGTYGMSVMTITSPEQLTALNRKERTHMSALKGGQPVKRVILQEGVYTFEKFDQATAEPVVYMIGQHVVGGFYRVHDQKSQTESLNTPGMYFKRQAFMSCCNNPDCQDPENKVNRFYAYGVVARLSLLAAAQEQRNSK